MKCEKCSREVSKRQYNTHFKACNGILKVLYDWNLHKLSDGTFQCPKCEKKLKSKRALISHDWLSHTDDGKSHSKIISGNFSGKDAWNKGLSKDTDIRLKKSGETFSARIKSGEIIPPFLGKHHTDDALQKIAKSGGYRKGSGRGKSGWYKGFWCDSSWELAFTIYNLEHNIPFTRNTEKFKYIFENKEHTYLPDYIVNGEYVEVKGYENEQWNSKISQFPHKLQILKKDEMQPYIEYAIQKYGKDFTKMYESRD